MKAKNESIEKAQLRYQAAKKRYFNVMRDAICEFEALGATAKALGFLSKDQCLRNVDEPAALLRIEVATALASTGKGD